MTKAFLSFPRSGHMVYDISNTLFHDLQAHGIDVIRVDDLFVGENWQAATLPSIKKADILIAIIDFPKADGRVMFEIGYAIGTGKPVILLCDNPSEIPFVLSSVPAVSIGSFGPWVIKEIVTRIEKIASKQVLDRPVYHTAGAHLSQALVDPECLEQISPCEFEQLIGGFLSELGYKTDILTGRNESGFDIIVHLPKCKVAVLVKKYASQGRLGIGDVQRLLGSCIASGMNAALMITNTGYTPSAKEFAAHSPIQINLMTLENLLSETSRSLTIRFDQGLKANLRNS